MTSPLDPDDRAHETLDEEADEADVEAPADHLHPREIPIEVPIPDALDQDRDVEDLDEEHEH